MNEHKFDPKKLQKLNNPKRLDDIPPARIAAVLPLDDKDVIVEIGAGTGFFSKALYDQYQPSTLYACDISAVMLDWITQNVVPGYPAIVPVLSQEMRIPLEDGIAGLVFSVNLHHELDDQAATVAEAFRLVKPGGSILVIDWKKAVMDEGPPVHIRLLPEVVCGQLISAGFEHPQVSNELAKHFMVSARRP